MKNLLKLTLTLFLALSIVSCSDDDDNGNVMDPGSQTIADFVSDNADYSTLLAALDRAGLVTTLDGTIEFTVFAPNNAAFDAFLTANNFTSLDDVPTDVLTNVLLNHVVSGSVLSTQLNTGYINTLGVAINGFNLSMYVDTSSGVTLNGEASVATADVEVDNGVIHAVDAVIGLPNVVTFATADPTFSTLVAALTRSDQPDFVSVLSTPDGTSPAPFTVFAPTNDAFGDLLTELGVGSLDDIDTATLTATLNTHVIAENNVRAADLTDGPVTTLGGEITIDATNATITDTNGRVSNIIVTDVQSINGVIHAIHKVILPTL
ncbi:fasciclin domain-containing protein [Aureisphaera galaxeae]|uniref:fasciclin domain-containing protein n=1 Tax=Aureisphaera galaxeae TaxID=1538023 RepID=UPI002350DC31|nr:fasciclin domain-containing protein [Aureisphaera galaxeae]MDC8005515.1 fasciclin domain-containing protein [Aureisphaera galaxeae]